VAEKAEKLVNPLDLGKKKENKNDSKLVSGIVDKETGGGMERILEEAPELDMSLIQEIEPPKSLLLLGLKSLFAVLLVFGAFSILFFTSQLTDKLDIVTSKMGIPNISKQLEAGNTEITTLQTDLNFYRFLQIKAFLDEFSYFGDSYTQNYAIFNSQTASSSDKQNAKESMGIARTNMREAFVGAREKLIKNFTAPLFSEEILDDIELNTVFEQSLRSKLNERMSALGGSEDDQALRDIKNYQHTSALIGKGALKKMMISTDFDALSDKDLFDLIRQMNRVVVNDLSIIQEIKDGRIKWSDIMNEIELRTKAVDSYYTDNFFDELGGIRYTSYDFDTSGKRITISGETRRFDTTNFTMIANLIDELNRSDFFENAEMRNFSKNGSLETGYTATLRLSLDLQTEELAAADENQPADQIPNDLLGL